jgi:hypothetical protein
MSSQILTTDFSAESSTPRVQAGTFLTDAYGRTWAYVQAEEALLQGDALEIQSFQGGLYIDADVDAAAAADTRNVTGTGDFTAAALPDGNYATANGHQYWLWVNAGAAQSQGGPITARISDNEVSVYWTTSPDGKIETALTTSSDYVVFASTRVKKTDASVGTGRIGGFVQRQGGVTDEYWFWALVRGWGIGRIDTSDSALVTSDGIVSGTADGLVQGLDTSAAAELQAIVAYAVIDSDVDGEIPILAACPDLFRPLPGAPSNVSNTYPSMSIGNA